MSTWALGNFSYELQKEEHAGIICQFKTNKKKTTTKTELELAKIRSVFILETKFKYVMLT